MNFQSGISRIFQCGSSFVNLASVACVVGKENVNRIWSLGQGIASLISKKDFKNRAHLACSMSVMFLWFRSTSSASDHQKCPSRHGHANGNMHFVHMDKESEKNEKNMNELKDQEGERNHCSPPWMGKAFCSLVSWWVWHPSISSNTPTPTISISIFSSCYCLSSVTIVPRADVQSSQI